MYVVALTFVLLTLTSVAAGLPLSVAQSSAIEPKNVILFFDDYPTRGDSEFQITREIALPLVAHVDQAGAPTDWMFDSFIFYSIYLYETRNPTQAYIDSWINYLFDGGQVGKLDSVVAEAKTQLGASSYQMNVFLALPIECKGVQGSDDKVYAVDESNIVGNLNTMLDRWNKLNPANLKLVGFYWGFSERPQDVQGYDTIIPSISNYVHSKGLKLLLIPWLVPSLYSSNLVHQLGFDFSTMQPNYAWHADASLDMFAKVGSAITNHYADGAELEFPVAPLESPVSSGGDWVANLQTYLDQAYSLGWSKTTLNSYYHGSTISYMARATSDPQYRAAYEKVYHFIKSTKSSMSVVKSESLNAVMVSNDMSPNMFAGQTYTVHIRVKNTGTTTWTAQNGYNLGLLGNTPFQPVNVELDPAALVSPSQEYTFTYNVTAPTTPGTYTVTYQMLRGNLGSFGQTVTVVISVAGQ